MAAKVSRVNENGSWILGNVLEYHAVPQLYEVQDEDDVNRLMHISEEGVKRLEDSASHLRKGTKILSIHTLKTIHHLIITRFISYNPCHHDVFISIFRGQSVGRVSRNHLVLSFDCRKNTQTSRQSQRQLGRGCTVRR